MKKKQILSLINVWLMKKSGLDKALKPEGQEMKEGYVLLKRWDKLIQSVETK